MRGLHVKLSDDAYESLVNFAAEQGVTVAALIEVLARRLPEWPEEARQNLIIEARRIAAERRRGRTSARGGD